MDGCLSGVCLNVWEELPSSPLSSPLPLSSLLTASFSQTRWTDPHPPPSTPYPPSASPLMCLLQSLLPISINSLCNHSRSILGALIIIIHTPALASSLSPLLLTQGGTVSIYISFLLPSFLFFLSFLPFFLLSLVPHQHKTYVPPRFAV